MQVRGKHTKWVLIPALVFMLILFSNTTIFGSGNNESLTVKGNQHYAFVLGVLDEGSTVKWNINSNDVSIDLYIAEASQYGQYAEGMSWSPVYENTSRTIHEDQYTFPTQANWTLVLENPNPVDALVTYDITIPVSIPSFTAISGLLGLSLVLIVRKKRRKKN